jgi:hypothetical protein
MELYGEADIGLAAALFEQLRFGLPNERIHKLRQSPGKP